MTESNRAIAQQYFDYWNAGDMDGWIGLLADDFRLHGKGMPISGVNHDLTRDQLGAAISKRAHLYSEPLIMTIDAIVGDGDHVVVQAHSAARLYNGSDYANNYSIHVHFRAGKITLMEEYCCTYSVVKLLREQGVGLG